MYKKFCDVCKKVLGNEYMEIKFRPYSLKEITEYDICNKCYAEGLSIISKRIRLSKNKVEKITGIDIKNKIYARK